MEILYIASLLSKAKVDEVFYKTGGDPGFAIMKFNRLIAEGFAGNGDHIKVLSSHTAGRNIPLFRLREKENGVSYYYIPVINLPLIKHLSQLVYNFIYVLFWGIRHHKNKAIVCDVLSLSSVLGALFASKLIGLRNVAIITDIPNHNWSGTKSKMGSLNLWMIEHMDSYVLLTEQMNEVVNLHKRPYIVVEGVVEKEVDDKFNVKKNLPRVIMYAGGLNSINGVPLLAKAVCELPYTDIKLEIYGPGNNKEEIIELSHNDNRIQYKGLKTGAEIIEAEKKATLLVNPRIVEGEYIKYSFPSKNLEYMQSGTPLLTTPLPCIPEDHKPFVYFFPAEATIEGYKKALEEVLDLPGGEIAKKGYKARRFVLKNKNNYVQARRITELIRSLH